MITSSDSFYGSFQMTLTAHDVHGDCGPGLLLWGIKHPQLEALSQHTQQCHVNVHMPYQALLQAVIQV